MKIFHEQFDAYQTVNMLIIVYDKIIFRMQYTEDISPWRDAEKLQKYQGQKKEDFLDIPLITKLTSSSYLQINSPRRASSPKIKRSSLLDAPLIGPMSLKNIAFKQSNSVSLPRFQLHSHLHHHLELEKSKLLNNYLPSPNLNPNSKRQHIYSKNFTSQNKKILYESIKEKMKSFAKTRQGSLNSPQNRMLRNKSQMFRSQLQPALKISKNIVFQYSSTSQRKKKEISPRKKKENHILDYLLQDLK